MFEMSRQLDAMRESIAGGREKRFKALLDAEMQRHEDVMSAIRAAYEEDSAQIAEWLGDVKPLVRTVGTASHVVARVDAVGEALSTGFYEK